MARNRNNACGIASLASYPIMWELEAWSSKGTKPNLSDADQ